MIKPLLLIILFLGSVESVDYKLPVRTINRSLPTSLGLTRIGAFGLFRKERPAVAAHYHTGIDIERPTSNYQDEPIFPISEGIVISKRQDGPFAQLIIEHPGDSNLWTVYEHIAGITVGLYGHVSPYKPIARFMNKDELDKFGWQFDHLHFEILKIRPIKMIPDKSTPQRHFTSYTLVCYSQDELNKYFYSPFEFFEEQLK